MGALIDKVLGKQSSPEPELPADPPAEPIQGGDDGSGQPPVDVSDESLLLQLSKRGIQLSSLDELMPKPAEPSEEEKQQAEIKRQAEIRSWGLKEGKVSTTELDSYARESVLPTAELAFELFKAERIAELQGDEVLDEEDARLQFEEQFHLLSLEDDPKRLRSQKIIKSMADAYLNARYGKVKSLADEYGQIETETKEKQKYQKSVEEAAAEVPDKLSIPLKGVDGIERSYNFKLSEETRKAAKDKFLQDGSHLLFGQMSKEEMVKAMLATMTQSEMQHIIAEVAQAHSSEMLNSHLKGRRGIPVSEGSSVVEVGGKNTSPMVSRMISKPENQKIIKN